MVGASIAALATSMCRRNLFRDVDTSTCNTSVILKIQKYAEAIASARNALLQVLRVEARQFVKWDQIDPVIQIDMARTRYNE